MGGISNAMENNVLDAIFGPGYTKPVTLYLALCTITPTATDTGSTITEPDPATQYGAYARTSITNNSTNFPAAASGQKSNGTTVTCPVSTGGASSPVLIVAWALLDSSSGGLLVSFAPLNSSLSVANGIAPSFAVGSIIIGVS